MQTLKYFRILSVVLILAVFSTGCKKKHNKQVAKGTKLIKSVPAGASILFKGNEIGKTPYTVSAKPNFYVIKLNKHGYRPRYASFTIKAGKNPESSYNLEKASASALVESSPSGAYITFNGKRIGETPCVMPDLPFGKHSIRLEKSGCAPKDLTFDVNSERPLKISAKLESNIGNINITSVPSGAKVLINGKQVGITPLKREYPDGTYTLTLQHSNYINYTTTLSVRKGSTISRRCVLNLRPGAFRITTAPKGARININGKYVGKSPLTLTDQPANRDLHMVIMHEGYASIKAKIRTSPGLTKPLSYSLKRDRGDLEFIINPPGVTVYVNGKKYVTQKGNTDKTSKLMTIKNLPPGKHTIRYHHHRAVPANGTISVKVIAGETTRVAKPITLWVPNAEIIYNDNSKETVVILSESGNAVYVEPLNGIRYEVLRSKIKQINRFKATE